MLPELPKDAWHKGLGLQSGSRGKSQPQPKLTGRRPAGVQTCNTCVHGEWRGS